VQSTNGLQLQVSINATSLNPGEPLQISINEYNALSTDNNVAAATNWKVNGLTIGACPNINVLPFGLAIFQGTYDAQNISQGTPLELFGAVPCAQLIRLITGYDFLPSSNNATIMPGGDVASPTSMSTTETVNGELLNFSISMLNNGFHEMNLLIHPLPCRVSREGKSRKLII
jgi:hypothetical protein